MLRPQSAPSYNSRVDGGGSLGNASTSIIDGCESPWNPRKYIGTIKQQRYVNSRSGSPSRLRSSGDITLGEGSTYGGAVNDITGRYSNYNGFRELSIDDRGSVLNTASAKKLLRKNSHSPDRIPKNNIVGLSKKCSEELEAKNWERQNLEASIKATKQEVVETRKKIERQVKKNRMVASETIKYERERSKLLEEMELLHKELTSLERENRKYRQGIDGLWNDNNAILQALYEAVKTKKETEENVNEARKVYYAESECRKLMVQSLRLHTVKNAAFKDRVNRQRDARSRLCDAVKGAALA